jgi:hypothetical protein
MDKSLFSGLVLSGHGDIHERNYIVDLANILQVHINVHVGNNKLPESAFTEEMLAVQRNRIRTIIPGTEIITKINDTDGMVIVSNQLARVELSDRRRRGLKILAPHFQDQFDPFIKKKIVVPIGRVDTSMKALPYAIEIAKCTCSQIVLYHTTRLKENCESKNWYDHMNDNAREMIGLAGEICKTNGIEYVKDINSVYPRLISEGIAEAAFEHDCNLIVMAIADDVVFGSHSSQILDVSPVPALIVE